MQIRRFSRTPTHGSTKTTLLESRAIDLDRLSQAVRAERTLNPARVEIADLAYDARRVTPGALFVCVPGHKVDGHDFAALTDAITRQSTDRRPVCVIANTVKGRGVSFMENVVKWHHGVPSDDEYAQAIAELERAELELAEVVG